MSDLQITCINKADRLNPYERITHVGGGGGLLMSWKKTQQEAIREIEARINRFYVYKGREPVWVIVRTSQYGNKYITTEADGESQNNLLSLPECPR
jgi:hypothetical protein